MILRIDCPDEKGLVAKITKVLYDFDLNITRNDEFVDNGSGHFFMRTEFTGPADCLAIENAVREVLPQDSYIQCVDPGKKKIVLFATKEHQCLSEILIKCEYKELVAEALAVVSNRESLRDLVEKFNVPFHFIDHRNISREDHERLVIEQVKPYRPDYLILAKYMRILTPLFVRTFNNRIINIHHSFLPAFKGANPYGQAFHRGVKIIGATAHFVNEGLDEGAIIAQDVIRINHRFTAKEMSKAGKDIEKIVLANALRLVFSDKVFIHENRTIVF